MIIITQHGQFLTLRRGARVISLRTAEAPGRMAAALEELRRASEPSPVSAGSSLGARIALARAALEG